jgi:hypothetical protein
VYHSFVPTTSQEEWELICRRQIAPYQADAIEENVRDRGVVPGTLAFYSECIAEAMAEDLLP